MCMTHARRVGQYASTTYARQYTHTTRAAHPPTDTPQIYDEDIVIPQPPNEGLPDTGGRSENNNVNAT